MSFTIEPSETNYFNGDHVDRYNLPEDQRNSVLSVDLTRGREGYIAEWESDIGIQEFGELLEPDIAPIDILEATATVVDPQGRNEKQEIGHSSVLEPAIYEHLDNRDCSYLLVRTPEYDIAWESWDESNQIILTAKQNDPVYLDHYFGEKVEQDGEYSPTAHKALQQGKQVVEEKSSGYE